MADAEILVTCVARKQREVFRIAARAQPALPLLPLHVRQDVPLTPAGDVLVHLTDSEPDTASERMLGIRL